MEPALKRDLLSENVCFGCGPANPAGLRIEVFDRPGAGGALRARFSPTQAMAGFPGMTPGGAVYTALDCLSTWVATVRGPNRGAAWVLRSAEAVYHRPTLIGEPLTLIGWIKEQGDRWDPLTVRAEARRADGALCVEGDFKVVPLSAQRLTEIARIDPLPENGRIVVSGVSDADRPRMHSARTSKRSVLV